VPSSGRLHDLARAGCAQRADDRVPALDGRAEAHRVEDVAAYLHHRLWQVRASRIAYQGSDVMSPLGGLGHGEPAEATGCPDNQEPHSPKTTATPGFHAEGLPSL